MIPIFLACSLGPGGFAVGMPVQCFNHVAKMWEDGVVPWQQDAKKSRCLFCDLLNCHWQSFGFVSGLLHLSEKCTAVHLYFIRVGKLSLYVASHSFRNTEVGRRYE